MIQNQWNIIDNQSFFSNFMEKLIQIRNSILSCIPLFKRSSSPTLSIYTSIVSILTQSSIFIIISMVNLYLWIYYWCVKNWLLNKSYCSLKYWLTCISVSSSFTGVLSNAEMPNICIVSYMDKLLLSEYLTYATIR